MSKFKSIAKFAGVAVLTFVVGAVVYRWLVKPLGMKVLPAQLAAYLP